MPHGVSSRIIIGVMGAGDGATPQDVRRAEELGELVAREGWVLLTGGRPAGVMEAAVRGAKRVPGSLTVGILPGADGPVADGVDIPIFTGIGHARNAVNVLSSRVVVTCGRLSPGTLSEAALAIRAGRPLVLLAPPPEAAAFLRTIAPALRVAATPQEAVDAVRDLLAR